MTTDWDIKGTLETQIKELPYDVLNNTTSFVTPALTNVTIRTALTNLSESQNTYGLISHWDVSRVTDMSKLFENMRNFNEDISKWNVSNVTTMESMFYDASSFNQPLNDWDV